MLEGLNLPAEASEFLESWTDNANKNKKALLELLGSFAGKSGLECNFVARPRVSYSFRFKHEAQKERQLFVMADVIDDDPESRWLSVCFFAEMINDPDELGDIVPEGLLGEDGYCFDVDEYDPDLVSFVQERMEESYKSAAQSG